MKKISFCVLIFVNFLFVSANVSGYRSYKNYKCFNVQGDRLRIERLRHALQESDETLTYADTRDGGEFIVAPHLEDLFNKIVTQENLKTTVVYDDISKIIQSEKSLLRGSKEFSWTAYYDIDDIYKYLTNMSKSYPNLSELIVGGKTYQGRSILGLRINTPSQECTPKPVIFIESGIHAREWIAPATTTYFIKELLTSKDANITALRDQFDWRIFPSVNPDGYHYSYTVDRLWRKTLSRSTNRCFGADPNRNWNYNWGQYSSTHNPCDYQTYAGSRPFSEIETRTLAAYIQSIDNMMAYISFHSYAAMLLLPYSDSTQHVHNYDDLVKVGKSSLDYGYKVNQDKRYQGPGTAAEILYKASGGSMDWVRHALGTPLVFTYELRGNSFHWPPSRIQEQGDEVTQMMLGLVTEANKLGYY
ncbi:PREDICTED: zinc carboxypeptidase-like [Papilio polytes]|uniref:zinc carboxypeptidase-like n=1 Tax=Papilio polytes TaxID=76194 RepID=UPI00067605F4|nr:PREDICTED: zinc carboxypeptidase-like [Papilio polytes]